MSIGRTLFVALAIVLVLLSGAALVVKYQKTPVVISIIDDRGLELEFFSLPQRLVVFDEAVANLLLDWQIADQVVACPRELKSKFAHAEDLGPRSLVTVSQVAAARPEMILAGRIDTDLAAAATEAGFQVLMIAPDRLESLLEWPQKIATLLAREQQGAWYTNLLLEQIIEFKNSPWETDDCRILWLRNERLEAAGPNTLEGDLLDLIGVKNALGRQSNIFFEEENLPLQSSDLIIAPPHIAEMLQALDAELKVIPSAPADDFLTWENVISQAFLLREKIALGTQEDRDKEEEN